MTIIITGPGENITEYYGEFVICSLCSGTGVLRLPCPDCNGTGIETYDEEDPK